MWPFVNLLWTFFFWFFIFAVLYRMLLQPGETAFIIIVTSTDAPMAAKRYASAYGHFGPFRGLVYH